MLKYFQQCYVKWFWTISSLGAPVLRIKQDENENDAIRNRISEFDSTKNPKQKDKTGTENTWAPNEDIVQNHLT